MVCEMTAILSRPQRVKCPDTGLWIILGNHATKISEAFTVTHRQYSILIGRDWCSIGEQE